jgi:hypothetical protein
MVHTVASAMFAASAVSTILCTDYRAPCLTSKDLRHGHRDELANKNDQFTVSQKLLQKGWSGSSYVRTPL